MNRAIEVFVDRIPRYADDDERLLLGLTAGFDSRTVLALMAGHPGLSGFTYGRPDCDDIRVGRQLAVAAGIAHETVALDRGFETRLGDLMVDTVWLSGGMQSCARASLQYAYTEACRRVPRIDAILSGVSGDQLLRGHGNVPSIVSRYMADLFDTGRYPDALEHRACEIFVEPAAAIDCMKRVESGIRERHGDPGEPGTRVSYLAYEVAPEYFAGEATLVDCLADFRTPFCDHEILDFAFTTRYSSLGLHGSAGGILGNLRKNFLVANLVMTNPKIARVPIQARPVRAFASGRPVVYLLAAAHSRLRRVAARERAQPHLENWTRWFAGPMWPRISALLARGARCESVLRRDFIDRCLERRDPFWLNKIVTAETILRLAEAGWERRDDAVGRRDTSPAV